ncbi:APO protein 3, mitochondrial [Linum perenne]
MGAQKSIHAGKGALGVLYHWLLEGGCLNSLWKDLFLGYVLLLNCVLKDETCVYLWLYDSNVLVAFRRPRPEWLPQQCFVLQHSVSPEIGVHGEPVDNFSRSGSGGVNLSRLSVGLDLNDPTSSNWTSSTSIKFELSMQIEQGIPVLSKWITFNRFKFVATKGIKLGPAFLLSSLTGGSIVGDMAPYQAFAVGGLGSVRGYGEGAVGAGRSCLVANSELTLPLSKNLDGALFLDCGTDMGSGRLVPGNPALRQGKPGSGVGLGYGIRYKSPVGHFQIDYAVNAFHQKTVYFGLSNLVQLNPRSGARIQEPNSADRQVADPLAQSLKEAVNQIRTADVMLSREKFRYRSIQYNPSADCSDRIEEIRQGRLCTPSVRRKSSYTMLQRRRLIAEYLRWNKLHLYRMSQRLFVSDLSSADDVPKPRRDKSERKPYVTPVRELIRRARSEREARKANPVRMLEEPPDNGLLVPQLVDVAHRVYLAREKLLSGVSKLLSSIPIQRCKFCHEVHVGRSGHEIRTCNGPESGSRRANHVWRKGAIQDVVFFPKCYHLHDRVCKSRVTHKEKHLVPRIPAIVELCIQAGVDSDKYPTKRRTKPVYSVEGRIVDFEEGANEEQDQTFHPAANPVINHNDHSNAKPVYSVEGRIVDFEEGTKHEQDQTNSVHYNDHSNDLSTKETSIVTMESWFEMLDGAKEMMSKYRVWTCGFCNEVQVGPKGHKVRNCRATKHQSRDGQHAWQEALIDDLVGPNFVWHVGGDHLNSPPLENSLKRYYGKAPAVVELCVQSGASVPDKYRSMMRLDVVPPDRDEVDLVA